MTTPPYTIGEPVTRRNVPTRERVSASLTTISAKITHGATGIELAYMPHIYAYRWSFDTCWQVFDAKSVRLYGPSDDQDAAVKQLRALLDGKQGES